MGIRYLDDSREVDEGQYYACFSKGKKKSAENYWAFKSNTCAREHFSTFYKKMNAQLFKHTSSECDGQEEFEGSASDWTNSLTG